jgi:hypothetical protein
MPIQALLMILGCTAAGCAGSDGEDLPSMDAIRATIPFDAALAPDASPAPTLDAFVPGARFDAASAAPDAGLVTPDAAATPMDSAAMSPDAAGESEDAGRPMADAEHLPVDAAPLDAAPADPDAAVCAEEEACDGLDDDCDGQVDEGRVCGPYIQGQCRIWAGWADSNRGPAGPSPEWGQCPAQSRSNADNRVHCTSTQRDGRWARLDLGGDVGGDDRLAVAFTCADDQNPLLADWLQTRCAVFLGWADSNRGPDGVAAWGACPPSIWSNEGNLRCTSSGYDGWFRRLQLGGDVGGDDSLAVAWICRDGVDPERAAAMSESVEVFLAWADSDRAPADNSANWGGCPAAPRGDQGDVRCVGTLGDERFIRLNLGGDVGGDDSLGFLLRARD